MEPVHVECCYEKREWNLRLVDSDDIIAGPFKTKTEAVNETADLGLSIANRPITIANLVTGTEFRVGGMWYRLRGLKKVNATVDVIGSSEQQDIPSDTVISELSILSLQ